MGRILAGSILGTAVAAALSCVAPVSIDGASCPCPAGYCCVADRCVASASCGGGRAGTGGGISGHGGSIGGAAGAITDGGVDDVAASSIDASDGEGDESGAIAPSTDGGVACGFTMPNPVDTGLPNPASYTLNSDDTVTDNVTGLTWASPVYSANQTGGHIVQQEVCAAMRPAGSWRLPTRIELVSLIDFTVPSPGPTIDRSAFSNTPSASSATSTPYAGGAGAKWYVNFNSGGTGWGSTNAAGWTRCVRKTTATCDATMRYQARSGGLVFDDGTGLTWQRTVDASFYSWGDAKTHCAALGPSWRLPSLTELQTIVDETKLAPSIDGAIFPDTPSAPFWTSSMLANSTTEAWTVHFEGGYNGSAYPNNLTDTLKVRCVR